MTERPTSPAPSSAEQAHDDGVGAVGEALVVTRSEEELAVSTSWRPYRRLRIAKRVVTETRTITVDVRREELFYEDLDVAGAEHDGSGPPPGGPLEFVLYEEQITVQTVVVPVERVRLTVQRVEEAVDVGAEVARERIVIDGLTEHPSPDAGARP